MRILVLSGETWNDKIYGNNVTSNWFEGMEAEFANIYCSPGQPDNKCCKRYFQITDSMMAKSIIGGKKAGRPLSLSYEDKTSKDKAEEEPKKLYQFLKSISGSFLRLVRELIWLLGRYNLSEMKQFIDDFKPDVIFSERMASAKMLRLEKLVSQLTTAPMIAFTGDDEYSLRQISFSPFFWVNRFLVRKMLREMVEKYKIYYTLSLEQKEDYEKRFGCKMKILQKCGSFEKEYESRPVHCPVRLIYAGKFYMDRWKVLGEIADILREINKDSIEAVLEIYTADKPTQKQKKLLDDGVHSIIKGRVSQEELRNIYSCADIALHVESRSPIYALKTRLSFSTKIIDCIFSGCAVLAYCRKDQSGWLHLKRENAAICVSSHMELKETLKKLCLDASMIQRYAKNAYLCGKKSHDKKDVQKMLKEDFQTVIENQTALH